MLPKKQDKHKLQTNRFKIIIRYRLISILYLLYLAVLISTSVLILRYLGYHFKRLEKFPYIALSKKVLGINTMRLKKEGLITTNNNLSHFYEWKPGYVDKYNMPWSTEEAYLTINKDGLNDTHDYPVSKDQGTFRIIALGDSFTQGTYAKTENSYPKKIEEALNKNFICPNIKKFEVLNFGVGGYDIEYAAQRYLTRGLKYQADLILWFLKDDDFDELAERARQRTDQYIASLTKEEKIDLAKWSKYDKIPQDIRESNNVIAWEKIYYMVREELLKELGEKQFFNIQSRAILSVAHSTKNPIILFTFGFTKTYYKMRMKSWANTEPNIRFFDGVRNIYELGASHRPFDGHPNTQGYTIIKEDIFQYLIDNYFKCSKR